MRFITPLDGATVSNEVAIEIEASDDRGISRVEVAIDGELRTTLDGAPFTWAWATEGLTAGPYVLTATAFDAADNSAQSSVTVLLTGACNAEGDCPPQSVRVVTPVDGATVCGQMAIEATATDDIGIARIEFEIDGQARGVADETPFAWQWDTTQVDDGDHVVRAVAYDTAGQAAFAVSRVRVRNSGGATCDNLPNVSLSAPGSGAFVFGRVPVTAQASDDVGVIAVEFFIDNGRVAVDDMVPYAIEWNTDEFEEGAHTLKAIARDTSDQTATNQIDVTVDRTAPEVQILQPEPGGWHQDTLTVQVEATDNFAVGGVDLWIGESLEHAEVAVHLDRAPWEAELDTSGVDSADWTLHARVTDRAGHEDEQTVGVRLDRPPTVRFLAPTGGEIVEGPMEVTVRAGDDWALDDADTEVEFFVDGAPMGRFDWQHSYAWTPRYEAGVRRLTAVAMDSVGQTTEVEVEITVDHPLEITLSRCNGGACEALAENAEVFGELPLQVTWRDDDGEVERVELFVDGDLHSSAEAAPFEFVWDTVAVGDGARTVRVRATSSNGISAERTVQVRVNNCDRDDDGFLAMGEQCGGTDCDDAVGEINPRAPDAVGDGLDRNCDGHDGIDDDGDGHAAEDSGGDDCADDDAQRHPGLDDMVGNDVDENCDGADGVDGDGDGHATPASGGDDCDDAAPEIHPGAFDGVGAPPPIDVPLVCDAQDVIVVDPSGGSVSVNTAGEADAYQGSCGGSGPEVVLVITLHTRSQVVWEVVDADYDTLIFLRASCDDGDTQITCNDDGGAGTLSRISRELEAGTYFLFVDGYYGNSGWADLEITVDSVVYDQDASPVWDADLRDAGVVPDAAVDLGPEPWPEPAGDGIDQNCDGLDGVDDDGDGHASIVSGGFDCADDDAAVHPCADDVAGDGFDWNCDGVDEQSCDDCNACTLDASDGADACLHAPIADGEACDDRDACTEDEVCQAGVCGDGDALVCDDLNPCSVDFCDAALGCGAAPVPDGEACPEGLCIEGACCVPMCDGFVCGDDGCGGSCGVCGQGLVCEVGLCVEAPDEIVDWVFIEGGVFQMGSNEGEVDERPVHEVTVPSFYLARTEVTVAQYRACFDAGACTAPDVYINCNWEVAGRDEHPINCVDWDQAQAFAAFAAGRLPTEAEWEYAARSGGRDQTYPWGNENPDCGRAAMDNCFGGTQPVCNRESGHSAQGVCDLTGNVEEWVEDWYGDYDDTPRDGSAHMQASERRVGRGGGWGDAVAFLRAADRSRAVPSLRYNVGGLGFRLSRSVP